MANIQDTQSGKMSPEPLAPIKEKISKESLNPLSKSKKRMPLCLYLKTINGPMPTYSWETDGALLTELLTLNTSESPNAAEESFLSQILEVEVLEKYYLSQKACQGILRRAKTRGKELPEILKKALEYQV